MRNDDDLRRLWNERLDRQLAELKSRFHEDQNGIMKAAAACQPQSATFADKDMLESPSQH